MLALLVACAEPVALYLMSSPISTACLSMGLPIVIDYGRFVRHEHHALTYPDSLTGVAVQNGLNALRQLSKAEVID